MANTYEWEDFIQEEQFKHSTLWLVPNEMAVLISAISVFAEPGTYTITCVSLGIQHEQLNASTPEAAKVAAIVCIKNRLMKYGNGLRGYMDKIKN